MGSAKKSTNAARKARIEEMRRAEQARERRNRILTIAASVVVVAGLVVGGIVLVQSQSDDSTAADGKGKGHFVTGSDGVKTWKGTLGRNHVAKAVDYPMEPPVGGDHNQAWMNCNGDVYTKALNNVNAVHSLEHGAVWITYTPDISESDKEKLEDWAGDRSYLLVSEYDDQESPFVFTAWNNQLALDSLDDIRATQFMNHFIQGAQTPERGASCTGIDTMLG
jgi:hypothetical protein